MNLFDTLIWRSDTLTFSSGAGSEPTINCAYYLWGPPDTGIMAPVIKAEASEARKMARPSISSGCPMCPRGIALA
jgi:hypothetical protein